MTGRSFLSAGDLEEPGFGLYSYLLLASAPANDEEKDRDLAVLGAFLQLLSDVGELESSGAAKSDLNVTYLLLTERPAVKLPPADWVLAHYDFPRAKVLLHLFGQDLLGGPYVTSTLSPLSRASSAPDHHLWQNMTHVNKNVAASWVQEFERRASHQDFWDPDRRNETILKLRDFITTAATALSLTVEGAEKFNKMLDDCLGWK